jgi:hypothetical protein
VPAARAPPGRRLPPTLERMNPLHIGVAVINLLCLSALFGSDIVAPGSARVSLLTFAVMVGYFANAVALLVSSILLIWVVVRIFSGGAMSTLRGQWLGLANGAVVVIAWTIFFALGRLRP